MLQNLITVCKNNARGGKKKKKLKLSIGRRQSLSGYFANAKNSFIGQAHQNCMVKYVNLKQNETEGFEWWI